MRATAHKTRSPSSGVKLPPPDSSPLPFRVFIAYHDFAAVRHAMDAIHDALRIVPRKVALTPMVWRFDQLARATWRDHALADAAAANVVVLASSAPRDLPAELEQWVGLFMSRQRHTSTTIVALLGAKDAWTITVEPSVESISRTEPNLLARVA